MRAGFSGMGEPWVQSCGAPLLGLNPALCPEQRNKERRSASPSAWMAPQGGPLLTPPRPSPPGTWEEDGPVGCAALAPPSGQDRRQRGPHWCPERAEAPAAALGSLAGRPHVSRPAPSGCPAPAKPFVCAGTVRLGRPVRPPPSPGRCPLRGLPFSPLWMGNHRPQLPRRPALCLPPRPAAPWPRPSSVARTRVPARPRRVVALARRS